MVPSEPCYLWRDGEVELWLPDTPLGRKIAERLQRDGAELIYPKNNGQELRREKPRTAEQHTEEIDHPPVQPGSSEATDSFMRM